MSSCCPICYRIAEKPTISSETDAQVLKTEALQRRFFQLFKRYLNNGRNEKVEQRRKPLLRDSFNLIHLTGIGMLSCEQCLKLMDQFCQLFHQLKTTELLLDWKVEQMESVIKSAQRVTTRMKAFREFANNLEGTAERMKGNEVFESVIQSRKLLISKCSKKLEGSFPKLSVRPWEPPDKENSNKVVAVDELDNLKDETGSNMGLRASGNCKEEHEGEKDSSELQIEAKASESPPGTSAAEGLFEPKLDSFEDIFSDSENEGLSRSDLSDSDKRGNETKPYSGAGATFKIVTEGEEVLGNVVKDPMTAGYDEAAKKSAEYEAHTSLKEIIDNSLSDASSVTSGPVQKRKRFYRNAVKKLKCNVVGCQGPEAFLREENLTCHQSFHGHFQCFLCDSSYDYAPNLSLHELETHRNDTRIGNWANKILPCPRPKCSYCTGTQKKFLRHHLREHLGLNPKGLEDSANCEICGIFFTGKRIVQNLQRHFDDNHNLDKLKEGETSLKCDQEGCSAYFLQPTQLWAHKRDVHETFKCFNCSDCDAVLKTSPGLVKHRQKHHPECFIYPCTFEGCTQRAETKGGLETHIRMKHIAKQVKCPECDKLFSNGHILQFHMKSHQPKIKRHICEHCGKRFKSHNVLKIHYLSHSGPSSWEFMCSICSKKLLTKQKLAEHMRTHSQEKLYVCEVCGAKYAQRHNLRIHVNNKHGDQVQDVPKKYDKSNLTSRKGIKRKRPRRENTETEEVYSDAD